MPKWTQSGVYAEIDRLNVDPAPSIVHWVTDPKYLSKEFTPFDRQLKWLLQLYEDYCPDCSDTSWINPYLHTYPTVNILKKIQPLEFGICPKCQKTRAVFVKEGKFYNPNELNVCAGMRSGKSMTQCVIATYQLHRFLTTPKAQQVFGMPTFEGVFTCATDTLLNNQWENFRDAIDGSPWFISYIDMLKNYEKKYKVKLFREKRGSLEFCKDVRMQKCYHSRARGFAPLIFASIDEIAWGEYHLMNQIYLNLKWGLSRIRHKSDVALDQGTLNIPTGIMVNISSPKDKGDKLEELLLKSTVNPQMISDQVSTWRCNPNIPYDILHHDMHTDPKSFWLDYGAIYPK